MPLRRLFDEFRRRSPRDAREDALGFDDRDEGGGPVHPRLVVGLGNPGARYGNTRHNVGAWAVAEIARRHGVKLERHGSVDRARVAIDGRQTVIARPRAFMNESGPPVAGELRRLSLRPEQLLVLYDDLDLPVGRIRLRMKGGSGGDRGMKSLIASIGTSDFPRIRIGIDRPYDGETPVRDPDRIADWVLSSPRPDERERLNAAVARAADAVEASIREGVERAMNEYNRAGSQG